VRLNSIQNYLNFILNGRFRFGPSGRRPTSHLSSTNQPKKTKARFKSASQETSKEKLVPQ